MDKNEAGQDEAKKQGGFFDKIGDFINKAASDGETHEQYMRRRELDALEERYQKEKAQSNQSD